MKNKGYTLLELLGVIVILSVLVILVFPSVINFIKKSNNKIDSITNDLIISAVEDYISDNTSELHITSGTEYCISIDTLIGKQYLQVKLNDADVYSSKSVKITYKNKINYEIIDSKDCSVCKLVSGNYNEVGSKYQCKVKDNMEKGYEDGYYFYLLNQTDGGMINLIMERNMYYDTTNDVGVVATSSNSNVAWYENEEDHSYGPVTAMTYLHNATKDWDNIPNMIMDYKDENIEYTTQQKGDSGYSTIKTLGTKTVINSKSGAETLKIENLKARLPRYDEVHGEGKCLTYDESNGQYGSCPLWLVNYLEKIEYYSAENGKIDIGGILGYWLLSSSANSADTAWRVGCYGVVSYNKVIDVDLLWGVRPVITIKNVIILD